MRTTAEREAAAEEQRIKAAAEDDARKIVEAAEQEITAVARAARRELTTFAADLAVSLAKKQIQVDAATDQTLVRDFAQQIPANGGERKGGNYMATVTITYARAFADVVFDAISIPLRP